MAFNIGLSGVNAAQADLKTTGNNIANAGTVGFKASRAEFADIYANSKYGATRTQIGQGVQVAGINQQFTQGSLSFTEKNLDLTVNGEGFYNLETAAGETVYTRNGQFQVDQDGYIVSNGGNKLLGYQVNEDIDTINTGTEGALYINPAPIEPRKTADITGDDKAAVSLVANLDSAEPAILDEDGAIIAISPTDPATYNHTTSFTSYDSYGNAMLTSMYFQKIGANDEDQVQWRIGTMTIDSTGAAVENPNATDFLPATGTNGLVTDNGLQVDTISFDYSGKINGTGELSFNITPAVTTDGGVAENQPFTIDISKLTQYGADFSVNDLSQNGYTTGNMAGIEVGKDGMVLSRYTNGQSKTIGPIMLSDFTNPQGLRQLGGNIWQQSADSGEPTTTAPSTGTTGFIQSGALEQANVDLTKELINLIISQRNFQANAKTLTTSDTVTQTAIQL